MGLVVTVQLARPTLFPEALVAVAEVQATQMEGTLVVLAVSEVVAEVVVAVITAVLVVPVASVPAVVAVVVAAALARLVATAL